jgi:hypothetical protein
VIPLLLLLASQEVAELPVAPDLPPPFRFGLVIGGPVGLTVASSVFERVSVHGLLGHLGKETGALLFALDAVYELPEIFGAIGDHGYTSTWFGAGLRYASGVEEQSATFGARVPFGVSYFLRAAPIELFASVAVGVNVVPEADTVIDGGVGIRLGF